MAQQPGSNYILVYRTPVVKRKSDQSFLPSSVPANVLEGCVADVSFLAGMMVDKAVYAQKKSMQQTNFWPVYGDQNEFACLIE